MRGCASQIWVCTGLAWESAHDVTSQPAAPLCEPWACVSHKLSGDPVDRMESREAENVFYTATSCQKRHILKIHNLKIHFSFQLQLGKFHAARPWLRAQEPSHTPLKNRFSKCLAFFKKRIGYLPKILAKFLILTNPIFFFLINFFQFSSPGLPCHYTMWHNCWVPVLICLVYEISFAICLSPTKQRKISFLATFLNSLFSFQLYWGIMDT